MNNICGDRDVIRSIGNDTVAALKDSPSGRLEPRMHLKELTLILNRDIGIRQGTADEVEQAGPGSARHR
jgi:hypothetical protein